MLLIWISWFFYIFGIPWKFHVFPLRIKNRTFDLYEHPNKTWPIFIRFHTFIWTQVRLDSVDNFLTYRVSYVLRVLFCRPIKRENTRIRNVGIHREVGIVLSPRYLSYFLFLNVSIFKNNFFSKTFILDVWNPAN